MIKEQNLDTMLRLAANAVMEKEAAFFDALDTSDVTVSPHTVRRVIRANRRMNLRSSAGFTIMKRAAVACLLALAILFGTVMSIPSVRAAFWDIFVTWYEEYIAVYFSDKDASETIEEEILPAYLPDGWTIEVVSRSSSSGIYLLSNDHGEQILYYQEVIIPNALLLDDSECIVETLTLNNDVSAYLCTYQDGRMKIVWQDRYKYMFVCNNVPRQNFISIATSICS